MNHRKICFRVLLAASAVLVMTTFIFRFNTPWFLWLAPVNLTEENVVAAWFSGTLLLLGSMLAADGYLRLRRIHFRAALAWCVIASMLLALSLDEIASLHERIEDWKTGPILSFVPFLLALLAGCAWSFMQLWLTPSERSKVIPLLIGFGLLVSAAGYELFERLVPLSWYLRPVHRAMEEGTELAGMLVLIRTALPNSVGLFEGTRPAREPAFSSLYALRWTMLVAGVVIAWPLAGVTASLGEQSGLGHFSDWMSCVAFTFSAGLLAHHWACSPTRESFPTSAVVLLCAASAICVQFDPIGDPNVFPGSSTIEWFGLGLNTRLVLLALCCLGAAESLRARGASYRSSAALLAIAGLMSAALSAHGAPFPLRWAYFATTAVALFAFAAVAIHALSTSRSSVPAIPG
jgi:hypothetical protein